MDNIYYQNLSSNNSKSNTIDKTSYLFLLIFLIIFLVISIYYFFNLLEHYFKNRKSNPNFKGFIYWIDYIFVSFLSITFVITYFIYLLIISVDIFTKGIDREDYELFLGNKYTLKKFLMWFPFFILVPMVFVVCDSILLDIMHNIFLIIKMKKLNDIKSNNLKEVYEKCKEEKFNNIFYDKFHIYSLIALTIIDLFALYFFGDFVTQLKEVKIENVIDSINKNKLIFRVEIFISVLQYLQFIFLILITFIMITSTLFKKKMLENNFYSNNILIQKIYNNSVAKISFHKDFFTYKTILDFIMNIPLLIYFSFYQLSTISLLLGGICIFIYIFFMGSILLYIEKTNKLSKISEKISSLFFLKYMNFNFGERERKKQIEELNVEFNEYENKIMSELSLNYINESLNKNNIQNSSLDDLIDNENEIFNKSNNEFIDLSKEENFFIIYKLIYLYFENNKKLYESIEKGMDDPIKNLISNTQNLVNENNNNKNNEDYLIGVEKINALSKINQKELLQSFKAGSTLLFQSLEEKEYKEQFKESNNLDENFITKKNSNLFIIKSYFSEEFFSLFPFYQISINDILNSLNPLYNKKLFFQFTEKKKENVKDKSIKFDNFYTYNSYLSFELYNENEIFDFSLLKKFIPIYKNYLMNIIKNMNYTFLPLMIGIYKINYLKKSKIIILYRNSLLYSQYNKFKRWINFSINETPEKISVSNNNNLLNMKEIEITNNISLNPYDYNELKKSLIRDLDFIKENIPFKIFPIINLFIGEEENLNNNEYNEEDSKFEKEKSFSQILDNENLFSESNVNISSIKKQTEGGTELISLFEKEYNSIQRHIIYSIKIYFTNFFRNSCLINGINENEENQISVNTYSDYMKNQVLNYLKCNKGDASFKI